MRNISKDLSQFNRMPGFTIIELMIAVALLGVLTAVAVPSFNTFIEKQKLRTDSESFAKALSFARAEAIVSLSQSVTVRWNTTASDIAINDTSVSPAIAQTLSPGFVAVMDGVTNEFLKVTEYKDSGSVSADNDTDDTITFDSLGRLNGTDGSISTFAVVFCSERGGDKHARRIEVAQTGRVALKLKENLTGVTTLACPAI